jgi:hypothetical protein
VAQGAPNVEVEATARGAAGVEVAACGAADVKVAARGAVGINAPMTARGAKGAVA